MVLRSRGGLAGGSAATPGPAALTLDPAPLFRLMGGGEEVIKLAALLMGRDSPTPLPGPCRGDLIDGELSSTPLAAMDDLPPTGV